MDVDVIK